MHRFRRAAAAGAATLVAAGAALFLSVPTAHAYPPPGDVGAITATCTTASAGQQCQVTFTLTQPNGQPAAGVQAIFSVSGCGSVNPTSGVTDAQGQVITTFTAGSSCCGTVTITATAPSVGVSVQTQINVKCSGGLPATGAAPPLRAGFPTPALVALIAATLVLAGSGLFLRVSRRRA